MSSMNTRRSNVSGKPNDAIWRDTRVGGQVQSNQQQKQQQSDMMNQQPFEKKPILGETPAEDVNGGKVKPEWQLKKVDPVLKRLRQNARVKRVVKPRNAIMVLNEINPDIVYKIDEVATDKTSIYRVHFEWNGKKYSGEGFSKSYAKQAACENALKALLMDKIAQEQETDKSEKMDTEGEQPDKRTPPTDDFPWGKLAGFALQKLLDSVNSQGIENQAFTPSPVLGGPYGGHLTFGQNPNHISFSNFSGGYPHPQQRYQQQRPPLYQQGQPPKPQITPRKNFPTNYLEFNPVSLFNQTWPHADPVFDTNVDAGGKIGHTAVLKLEGFQFTAAGPSKKVVKTHIAKAVISTLKGVKYPDGFVCKVIKA